MLKTLNHKSQILFRLDEEMKEGIKMTDVRKVTILSDMDGTLVSSDGTVSEKNKEAIRKFIRAGGYFGIATGRGHVNVLNYTSGVEINAPSVLYNGAMLYDFKTGKSLRVEKLPEDDLIRIIQMVQKRYPKIMVHIYTPDTCFLVSKEKDADEKILGDHQPAVFDTLEKALTKPWIKILMAGRNEDLKEIEKELETIENQRMRWVYSADIYLEILPEGVSKAAMISNMKEFHGGDHTVIAIGDYYNDLEMLKEADFGIAMGNAPDEIKAVADMTTLSNDEDGVARVIDLVLSGNLILEKSEK